MTMRGGIVGSARLVLPAAGDEGASESADLRARKNLMPTRVLTAPTRKDRPERCCNCLSG